MARKRPVRLEDLFAVRAVGHVAMSPDGRQVAFECKRFDLAENRNFCNILLADVQRGTVRPLTSGKQNDTLPQWSRDGKRLAFLSDREKPTGLYILPMSGGEPQRLTDRDGAVSDFAWSPDGRRLAYTSQALSEREKLERDGKHEEVKKRPQFKHITRLHHKLDGVGFWNGNYTHVYVVSSNGGRPKQLTRGDFDDAEPRFSPDGRWVSFLSNRLPNRDTNLEHADIYLVRPTGGPVRQITTTPGARAGQSWSPDGRSIAYIGNPAKAGEHWKHLMRVWVVDLSGGRPREITRDVDNMCSNWSLGDVSTSGFAFQPPIWSADGSRLYFLVSERGAGRLYSRALERRDTRLEYGGNENVLFAQRTGRDGPIAVALTSAVEPGEVAAIDVSATSRSSTARLLMKTQINRPLTDRVAVAEPERIVVKSGAAQVEAWVLKPPDFNPRRKYPAILQIHGGPHAQYGYMFYHELQWMAARGYVVAYGNPRGSAGYGLKFMNCIHADWGNLDYQDVMRVADWLFSRPYVDRRRVGVTGGSYGGYMTNWIVTHTHRFTAAVTQRCVSCLESLFGTSDFGYDLGIEFGGFPWEERKNYLRQSPLTFVKNVRTPLLIEHEESDLRCSIEQAEQFFTALKTLGRTVEFVRFEGESHGLCRTGRPQNRAERLRRIMGWFEKHMPSGAQRRAR